VSFAALPQRSAVRLCLTGVDSFFSSSGCASEAGGGASWFFGRVNGKPEAYRTMRRQSRGWIQPTAVRLAVARRFNENFSHSAKFS